MPIIQNSNPLLHKTSQVVSDFSSAEVSQTIVDLIDTMREANLIGMAAPQIGKSLQIFVTEIRKTKYRNPQEIDMLRVFVNPQITNFSTEVISGFEGCGSLREPAIFAKITRPKKISVKAYGQDGQSFTLDGEGLLSRVIQHEIDHLQGIVCIEKQEEIITEEEYLKMINQQQ
ncbi:peptide deformylase [Candidatus Microgenomates bacterium]|nr:peptide deformylase [Candidatus Microgenomates bacterium]